MSASSDRNLLFGILALQMDVINREQLITGMQGWMLDKSRSLGEILVRQNALAEPNRAKLEEMVAWHIQMHGADPARSLAAVSSVESSLKEALRSLADPQVDGSLTCLPDRQSDPEATRSHPGGSTNVPGTRFKILRFHAQGGLGQVSVALDSELNREVAFKEIQARHADQSEARLRFVLEAEVTGGLEHPGIVPVYGLGHYPSGRPFYAMKFIRGDSLKQAIERYHTPAAERVPNDKPVPTLRDLLGRFIDVCQAMQYAHDRGVLHRDLKPGNIMLGHYGETLVVDWGLAKPLGKSDVTGSTEPPLIPASSGSGSVEMTQTGGVVGTPAYMSPEQAAGRLDELGPASDVYSLGATLYHLLTGRVPFEGADVLQKVQCGDFRRPRAVRSDILPALEAICLKAMQLAPEQRYARPAEMAADIEHWLADEPVSALPEKVTARLARFGRRNRAWVQAGMAALLLIAVVTAWGYFREAGLRSNLVTTNQSLTTALSREKTALAAETRAKKLATENEARAKAALMESTRRLAENHFQRGIAEDAAGRLQKGILEFAMAYTLTDKADPLRPSYMRVLQDRLTCGGRSLVWPMRHEGEVTSVVFSPDGTRILTGSLDKTARLWDGRTGTPLGEPMRHEESVYRVVFSPDGTRVLTASRDKTARLWDGRTGAPLGEPMRHVDFVNSVTFSPDGTRVLIGSMNKTARLWDGRTGTPLGEPMRHKEPVYSVTFNPDGTRILTGSGSISSGSGEARLWDGQTGAPLGESMRHGREVASVAFSPDGTRVLTGSWDNTARLWDGRTGTPLGEPMRHEGPVNDLAFSPDGTRILTGSGDKNARLWDGWSGAPLGEPMRHEDSVTSVAFSPDGARVLTGSWDNTARLWDGRTGAPLEKPLRHGSHVRSVTLSPDGTRVLTGSSDNTARLWDGGTGTPLGDPMRHEDFVSSVAFSPDGTRVLTGSWDKTARLWDGRTGAPLGKPLWHEYMVNSMTFSPDGTRVLTGSGELKSRGEARLWDAHTGALLGEPMRHKVPVRSVAFSSDGTRILTGSGNNLVARSEARLWDGGTGAPLGKPMWHESGGGQQRGIQSGRYPRPHRGI